ncbi:MAG: glycosyltransferase [Acidobacteriota bacterium]
MVSIVIPTFNRVSRVQEAVESVRAQSYRDWELLVIDDGSEDGTEAAIRSIEDSRVRYVRVSHGGVSRARNIGIRLSRFPWICFLDSDDRWAERKLELQLETLEREPALRIVYTDEIWIRRGRRVNQKKKHRKYSGWMFRPSLALCLISPSSVLLHRSVLTETGLFDESFRVCEDYELWLRLTSRFPVRFIDQPLITKFGGHPDQLSHSEWGFDRFRIRALLKTVVGGGLTAQYQVWTAAEIVRKALILAAGYRNRNKQETAAHYRRMAQLWLPRASWAGRLSRPAV